MTGITFKLPLMIPVTSGSKLESRDELTMKRRNRVTRERRKGMKMKRRNEILGSSSYLA
jgi:hypothetical protein